MLIPKLHMMTKYTSDIRMNGFSTMHSERLHKQPSKRTNYRDVASFTAQLVTFIEDRDVLYDIYGPSKQLPLSPTNPSFTLKSKKNGQEYDDIDLLEEHDGNLRGLQRHIILYLDSLFRKSRRPMSRRRPLKKQYNDCVRAVDVTKPKVSAEYQEFYFKVIAFVEVAYGDGKKYRLCVGHLFEELEDAHPTGYTILSNQCPGDLFLLNHDVNQHSWANATPFDYELDNYVGWKTDGEHIEESVPNEQPVGQDPWSDDDNDIDTTHDEDDNNADLDDFSRF
ncbi:unnamed protein product [Absidia cylindrospora]